MISYGNEGQFSPKKEFLPKKMGKYNAFKVLKKKIAYSNFQCRLCKQFIKEGDSYYSEQIKDKFLHSLHNKKFCKECVEKFKKQLPPVVD